MDWTERLAGLAARFEVPGAVLGIWADGEQTISSYGVTSVATGVPVTADTVFQVGSITKLWTATMILQLVAEGRLGLDSTVAELLPGVRLSTGVEGEVTVRHLLTHTSGVDGDIFTDTGRGDDCVKRYVDLLAGAAQIFPPGAAYSYCNAGFVLLGRIIEVLDGRGWDESLRVRLAEPLGTTATVTLPEEAILHRAAVGHVQSDGRPVRTWALPRSIGPAGLITQRAADLLAFARLHLDDGVTADGTRLLPAELIRSMHVQQVAIPLAADGLTGVGLGFRLHDWNGRTLIGHDGGTVGQLAYLRIDPRARLAVCLLTNSPNAPALSRELLAEVFSSYAGLTAPPALEPGAGLPAGAERHAGRYERAGVRFDVDQRLHLTVSATGDRAAFADDPVHEYDLRPVGESGDRFALQESPGQPWTPLEFAEFADGTPYLFSGGRVTPRAH